MNADSGYSRDLGLLLVQRANSCSFNSVGSAVLTIQVNAVSDVNKAILAIQVDALLILSKGRAILVAALLRRTCIAIVMLSREDALPLSICCSAAACCCCCFYRRRTTITAILFADAKPFERAVAVTPAAVITY